MAKISSADSYRYLEGIKTYKALAEQLLKEEQTALAAIKQNPEGAALSRLELTDKMLNLTSQYIVLNNISQSVLKVKNEDAINDGRKSVYKSVGYLEEIVSGWVDVPFSDYEDKLTAIASLDAERRYRLVRKMGLAIQLLENAYGDNNKWKWSFVELDGRFAAVAKNILNLKTAVANRDPRSPDYEPTVYHLRLIKKLLVQAADRYREKYELSTNRIDDFKTGIQFLDALRRIHTLMGEQGEAETLKKKSERWAAKLEADDKKQKEAMKSV
jgi:hypothetical protein